MSLLTPSAPVTTHGSAPRHRSTKDSSTTADRLGRFLAVRPPLRASDDPCGLDAVRQRYAELRAAMPWAQVHCPVRADPTSEVLTLLASLGSSFDVTSSAEIDRCLELGIPADRLSYGEPLVAERDIRCAARAGIPVFTVEASEQLTDLLRSARRATVLVRLASCCRFARCSHSSLCAQTDGRPPTRPSGATLAQAEPLLLAAARAGWKVGVAVHACDPQTDVDAWSGPIRDVGWLARRLRGAGYELAAVDLGGGLPSRGQASAPVAAYGALIRAAMAAYLGDRLPGRVTIEPGPFVRERRSARRMVRTA